MHVCTQIRISVALIRIIAIFLAHENERLREEQQTLKYSTLIIKLFNCKPKLTTGVLAVNPCIVKRKCHPFNEPYRFTISMIANLFLSNKNKLAVTEVMEKALHL